MADVTVVDDVAETELPAAARYRQINNILLIIAR